MQLRLPGLVYALFFLSGAAGLLYEIAWAKLGALAEGAALAGERC